MTLLTTLPETHEFTTTGSGVLPSAFAVTDLARRSVAAVGIELARFMHATGLTPAQPPVSVDQRLAALWFKYSFRPKGWELPDLWDDIAGLYETKDGWIRLHTNLPHHRAAALRVLGCAADKSAVCRAVLRWQSAHLEAEIHAAGGVAAALHSQVEWAAHPQGQALAHEPLVGWDAPQQITLRPRPQATVDRPLAGLRVLDLTRVLAGPVATRTLAGLGASVLRIDPPGWDEPGVIQDISLGKTMATLDLKSGDGRAQLESLLSQADVLVHGYRPGALDRLGLDLVRRDALAPNRVEVALNAYGWTGPWAQRRGFDSLVQLSTGIADTGRQWAGTSASCPLPVQALDHATGYLMAAAVLSALHQATSGHPVPRARLSLARTAAALDTLVPVATGPDITASGDADFAADVETTPWGPGHRLASPLSVSGATLRWATAAAPCGSHAPDWSSPA